MDASKQGVFLLIYLLIGCHLTGCTASAAISGAQAVYTRQSIKQSFNEHYVNVSAYRKIYLDTDKFKNTNVTVLAFNKRILLVGQVENDNQKKEIEDIVRKTSGIDKIHNLINIGVPPTSLVRISDTWITAKINSKLIAANDIDPSQVKVLTEEGTVYLMGIIPHEQAEIATDIARTTSGVGNVVTVFEYITISRA